LPIEREYGILLRKAFLASIDILGESGKAVMRQDLHLIGVDIYEPDLTLTKLWSGIKAILGQEAAEVMLERVLVKLDQFYSTHVVPE
jgi:hypothetical protein